MKDFSNKHLSAKLPNPRPEIERMNAYSAPLEGRRELLRLDFNENTIGPSPKVVEAIRNFLPAHIAIYPEYSGLKEAVVKNINSSNISNPINSNQVGIFNGVDAAIHAIFHSFGVVNSKLLTTIPTFGYYSPCALMQGMEIIEIPYEGNNFQFPFNAIYKSLVEIHPKLLVICNPNNPTGTKLAASKILELANASPETLIIIDELYESFLGESVLPISNFKTIPNLVVLRSLSKTSGLAGLRIGFAIGHPEIINHMRSVTGPYDVNSFAVKAAFAALSDQQYINNYVKQVLKARIWIQERLITYKIKHHMESGNFFLLWPKKNVYDVESSLKSYGILVRNMSAKPYLQGGLRVSIGVTSQMQVFWEAFKKSDEI